MSNRNIRVTRDRLGLSTAALANLVGVNNRTAHRWLAGKQDVPESVWRLLEVIEDGGGGAFGAAKRLMAAVAKNADEGS